MIVRESPNAKKPTSNVQWPPKSPLDAVLCSPNGRKKVRRLLERSVSPSPVKRKRVEEIPAPESEDDDDEETLRLKLQVIEARLRLKELQKAKVKESELRSNRFGDNRERGRARDRDDGLRNNISPHRSIVEVPTSPKRVERQQIQPDSPRRVQLGIDKGVTAKDISLRKARVSNTNNTKEDPRNLQRAAPIKSFNERLTEARSTDYDRHQKQERLKQVRSNGFGVSNVPSKPTLMPFKKPGENPLPSVTPKARPGRLEDAPAIGSSSQKTTDIDNSLEDIEEYSQISLTKRHLSTTTVSAALAHKEPFTLPRLLKTVTSPHYDPPDVEDDYVVFGVIASKSSAHNTSVKHKTTNTADDTADAGPPTTKFMAIKLTDLTWSIDLFLFDTAFDRFWKLTVGSVIAILNPGIMPPKAHLRDTGAFSLKLASSEDTILEIGVAQDLGFCKSVKRDGQLCGQWVDTRTTEFCEFHVNMQVEKTKAGRMEINSMVGLGGFGRQKKSSGRGGGGRGGAGRGGRGGRGGALKKEGAYYDREAHETAYMVPKELNARGAQSAAKLLDADDYVHGGLNAAERSRKRIAAQAKERDIMAKLGANGGGGLGSEYARIKSGNDDASARKARGEAEPEADGDEARDATSLGLVGLDAKEVRLSPAKGGKTWTGQMKEGGAGWSKAFQRGLPEKSAPEVRKTKVVESRTASKVQRPTTPVMDDDDDDDGLDII